MYIDIDSAETRVGTRCLGKACPFETRFQPIRALTIPQWVGCLLLGVNAYWNRLSEMKDLPCNSSDVKTTGVSEGNRPMLSISKSSYWIHLELRFAHLFGFAGDNLSFLQMGREIWNHSALHGSFQTSLLPSHNCSSVCVDRSPRGDMLNLGKQKRVQMLNFQFSWAVAVGYSKEVCHIIPPTPPFKKKETRLKKRQRQRHDVRVVMFRGLADSWKQSGLSPDLGVQAYPFPGLFYILTAECTILDPIHYTLVVYMKTLLC